MNIVSVNVGMPRAVRWQGQSVLTSIFKDPVAGTVPVRRLNLDGDRQSDLSVHGGVNKAVYGYPSEHYEYWRSELPGEALPWGSFGENLTTQGLIESELCIGDELRIGTVLLRVTQPRVPCYKLGIRFQRNEILKTFLLSGYSGFYFCVVEEGEVAAGDPIEITQREPNRVSIADINRLYIGRQSDPELLGRAVRVDALPAGWKDELVMRAQMRR